MMLLNSSRSLREGHRLLAGPGLCVAARLRLSEAGREMSRNSEGDAVEQRTSVSAACCLLRKIRQTHPFRNDNQKQKEGRIGMQVVIASESARNPSDDSLHDSLATFHQADEKCATLAAASRSTSRVRELDLAGSQDLMCTNMMCEKVKCVHLKS